MESLTISSYFYMAAANKFALPKRGQRPRPKEGVIRDSNINGDARVWVPKPEVAIFSRVVKSALDDFTNSFGQRRIINYPLFLR